MDDASCNKTAAVLSAPVLQPASNLLRDNLRADAGCSARRRTKGIFYTRFVFGDSIGNRQRRTNAGHGTARGQKQEALCPGPNPAAPRSRHAVPRDGPIRSPRSLRQRPSHGRGHCGLFFSPPLAPIDYMRRWPAVRSEVPGRARVAAVRRPALAWSAASAL